MKQKRMINKNKKTGYQLLSFGLITALTLPIAVNASMRNSMKTVSAASLQNSMVSSVGIMPGVSLKTYKEKLEEAEKKKAELEQNQQTIKDNIANLNKKKNDILEYIKELDAQLNDITALLDELDASILETNEELDKTRKDLEEAKETEAKQYETMKRRIQYLYENGSDDIIEVFMNSGNIVDFLNQVEYSKKISEYDNNLLQTYIATKEQIADQEAYLATKLDELKAQEEAKLNEQNTLQELSAAKGEEIIRYTESIDADEELFQEYAEQIASQKQSISDIKEEEKKRIEEEKRKAEEARKAEEERKKKEEQDRLNASQNVQITGETGLDKMIWPLPGDGRVFSKFGYRKAPTAGASTYHRGVDIGGAQGADIVASLAGTVEAATYSVSGGNYIKINHGNGVVTKYLHCSKLLVGVGDKIKQGQVIAKVGSTGISTGPHLHFSLVINGVDIDPLLYISYK